MTLKGNYASKCVIYATLGLFSGKDVCIANRCSAHFAVAELLVVSFVINLAASPCVLSLACLPNLVLCIPQWRPALQPVRFFAALCQL